MNKTKQNKKELNKYMYIIVIEKESGELVEKDLIA